MDRSEAIKKLERYVGNECYTDEYQEACKMAIAALQEQERSGWVSVNDKLPKQEKENYSEYLVVVVRSYWPTSSYDPIDSPYEEEYTTVAMYDSVQKLWHLERSEVVLNALLTVDDAPVNGEYITHWMPLPEPPDD